MIWVFDIFEQIGNVISAIFSIIEMLIWVISGLDDVITLISSALDSLLTMLDIFPVNAASALMAVCGGLFVLRIFGRS